MGYFIKLAVTELLVLGIVPLKYTGKTLKNNRIIPSVKNA